MVKLKASEKKVLKETASRFANKCTDIEAIARGLELAIKQREEMWDNFKGVLEKSGFNSIEIAVIGWKLKGVRMEKMAERLDMSAEDLVDLERSAWVKIKELSS